MRSVFARFMGEDPRRETRFVIPYAVSGLNLTPDEMLSLGAVWACIDIISRSIAACKWCIYQPLGNKRRKLLDDDWKTWMLNTRPNPEITAIAWRESMLFQAIPFGNAYSEIVRDRGGRVVQLWPLISERMWPKRDPDWNLVYEYRTVTGEFVYYKPEQIFHLRGPGIGTLMGDNIVARAAKTLGVAAAQERFSASFFGQGAMPGGVLEYPGKITPERHAILKEDWAQKHKGPENQHKPLILENGMTFKPLGIDPQKSQLTEARQFSVEEICRWFGVPPHKVQHLLYATFSNIEHSSIEFVRDALSPWAIRLCQEADYKLFPQTRAPWLYTEINLRPLTRGDAQSRALAHASWRQNGIMSSNEIRAEEGLDDCGPDGDVLIVQSNMTTIEQILNPPQPTLLSVVPGQADSTESDSGDTEFDPSTQAVARQALIAALGGALERYGRRLSNQKARKSRAQTLDQFREEQVQVIIAELHSFSVFAIHVIGRELSAIDVATAVSLYERGSRAETIIEQTLKTLLE
jgi:HK97 family phage portal protein